MEGIRFAIVLRDTIFQKMFSYDLKDMYTHDFTLLHSVVSKEIMLVCRKLFLPFFFVLCCYVLLLNTHYFFLNKRCAQ